MNDSTERIVARSGLCEQPASRTRMRANRIVIARWENDCVPCRLGCVVAAVELDVRLDDLDIVRGESRRSAVWRGGDGGPAGESLVGGTIEECVNRAAAAIGWRERMPRGGRGKGTDCIWWLTT